MNFRRDTLRNDRSGMEEIGFLYVFLLSVILLSAVMYTIEDSTRSSKKSATITFYEDTAHNIAGVVQDVINMCLINPAIDYTRNMTLGQTDLAYNYRIEFTNTSVTLISRVGNIRVSTPLYNPEGIEINENIGSNPKALMFQYDSLHNKIVISVIYRP